MSSFLAMMCSSQHYTNSQQTRPDFSWNELSFYFRGDAVMREIDSLID